MTARDHNRTESESRGVGRDILISKKLGHAETVSGKLVDFRKTRYHDSALQSEAESTNEKNNGGLNGGTVWRDCFVRVFRKSTSLPEAVSAWSS